MVVLAVGIQPDAPETMQRQALAGWLALIDALQRHAPAQLAAVLHQVHRELCTLLSVSVLTRQSTPPPDMAARSSVLVPRCRLPPYRFLPASLASYPSLQHSPNVNGAIHRQHLTVDFMRIVNSLVVPGSIPTATV
jgi:hypothetical protein